MSCVHQVTAVDFLEDCIATNQVENSKFDNIKFVTSDVMDLEVDKSSVDAVFSNWLFMYLNDSEVLDLLRKADLWVRPQGERREGELLLLLLTMQMLPTQ